MNIEIRFHNSAHSPSLVEYVKWRLPVALDRREDRLGPIVVHLGRHGGAELTCRITARILPVGQFLVESRAADPFDAIDRAVAKMGETLTRRLDRAHGYRRAFRRSLGRLQA